MLNNEELPRYYTEPQEGISTGFLTWDYNTNGLEPGTLTILAAKRNAGKTTMVYSLITNFLRQGEKVFAYLSEGQPHKHRSYMAMSLAKDSSQLERHTMKYGNVRWLPSAELCRDFDELCKSDNNEELLTIDKTEFKAGQTFAELEDRMFQAAIKGTRIFVIDSLMSIENIYAVANVEQQILTGLLKRFAEDFNCAVLLLAHPSKGGLREVGGSSRIENLADHILFLERINSLEQVDGINRIANKINPTKAEMASSVIYFTKVRDNGTYHTQLMTWNREKACPIDLCYIDKCQVHARFYESENMYSIPAGIAVEEKDQYF